MLQVKFVCRIAFDIHAARVPVARLGSRLRPPMRPDPELRVAKPIRRVIRLQRFAGPLKRPLGNLEVGNLRVSQRGQSARQSRHRLSSVHNPKMPQNPAWGQALSLQPPLRRRSTRWTTRTPPARSLTQPSPDCFRYTCESSRIPHRIAPGGRSFHPARRVCRLSPAPDSPAAQSPLSGIPPIATPRRAKLPRREHDSA